METDLDAFLLQELHQTTTTNSETSSSNVISSWLNLDSVYTPGIPIELQELENHLLHFDTDKVLPLPGPYSPFLQDFYDDNTPLSSYSSIPSGQPTVVQQPVPDEYDAFLSELCFSTPAESQESVLMHDSTSLILTSFDVDNNIPQVITEDCPPVMDQVENKGDEEDNEDETDEDPKPSGGALNCKNLVSERNRRKRLSQQLLALRSLVPNITKMDKRSVLVDALSYLRSIQEETARLQKELKEQPPQQARLSSLRQSCQDNPAGTLRIPGMLPSTSRTKSSIQITEVDVEKIEDRRFIVKITCKGGIGMCGDVLRVMESMGFEITYASLLEMKPHEILSTIFIRVRKQGKMTEEKLKDNITSMALRSGLTLRNP